MLLYRRNFLFLGLELACFSAHTDVLGLPIDDKDEQEYDDPVLRL
jgi:hypothetical protein